MDLESDALPAEPPLHPISSSSSSSNDNEYEKKKNNNTAISVFCICIVFFTLFCPNGNSSNAKFGSPAATE